MKIFVSHTHADRPLVDALKTLLGGLFPNKVEFAYSSDRSPGGGIDPGIDWFQWIVEQIRSAQQTFVLLTPRAVGRPWVLWESGAAAGVAMAVPGESKVVPLFYRLPAEQIPGPLQSLQAIQGESEEQIKRLVFHVNEQCGADYPSNILEPALAQNLRQYFEAVTAALAEQPLVLDEGATQEWIDRIDRLRSENRHAEVSHVLRALNLAYGEPNAEGEVLLDPRLHRRLGEAFLAGRLPGRAVQQFRLAVKSSPRDIYLMHQLALAHLENQSLPEAENVLKALEQLDPNIAREHPDIAGLKGRLFRMRHKLTGDERDLRAARDAYWDAMEHNKQSYYVADVAAQLSLQLGEKDKAKEAFRHAVDALKDSAEVSIWSLATHATASLATGDEATAIAKLRELAAMRPEPRQIDSIIGGLERLRDSLAAGEEAFERWTVALRGM